MSTSHRARLRLRTTPLALVTGLAAATILALTMSGTLSAFSASITNPTNTAASGTLVMRETGPSNATCSSSGTTVSAANSATCSSINKFGGSTAMTPGTTVTVPIAIANTGTTPAETFTLTPSACVPGKNPASNGVSGDATDICSKMNVVVRSGATQIFSGTLASLGTSAPSAFTLPKPAPGGDAVPFTFEVTLDQTATNSHQGLSASVPLTWTFTAGK